MLQVICIYFSEFFFLKNVNFILQLWYKHKECNFYLLHSHSWISTIHHFFIRMAYLPNYKPEIQLPLPEITCLEMFLSKYWIISSKIVWKPNLRRFSKIYPKNNDSYKMVYVLPGFSLLNRLVCLWLSVMARYQTSAENASRSRFWKMSP